MSLILATRGLSDSIESLQGKLFLKQLKENKLFFLIKSKNSALSAVLSAFHKRIEIEQCNWYLIAIG